MQFEPEYRLTNQHHDETIEKYATRFFKKFDEYRASLVVVAKYPVAAIDAKTENGGEVVTAASKSFDANLEFALVGDKIRYPDGREEKITSSAGEGWTICGVPAAIIVSHVIGGNDLISNPIETGSSFMHYQGESLSGGFLVEGCVSSFFSEKGISL